MTIDYYRQGERTEVQLTPECGRQVPELLAGLMAGTTEMVRLLVSAERIESIRNRSAIEFIFQDPRRFESRILGEQVLNRVLVPLDDSDYIGNPARPFVILFIANETGYLSGPLLNPNAFATVQEIRECIS
jgi:hypothetical protein